MRSVELVPCPALRRYVKLIWCLEADAGDEFPLPERVAPDGILEFVIHYGTPLLLRYGSNEFCRQPTAALISQTRRFVEFLPSRSTGFVSVRFFPWGACHFLRPSIHDLADRQLDAEDVWGASVRELVERMVEAKSAVERARLVERFLMDKLRHSRSPDYEVAVRCLQRDGLNRRVSDVCLELGVTERRLERICRASLGVAPRQYLRLVRFLRACRKLKDEASDSLTESAYQSGYFDQAHLNHDFRRFIGLTPAQFRASDSVSFLRID